MRKPVTKDLGELSVASPYELRRYVPGLASKLKDETRENFRTLALLFEKHALKNPDYEWSAEEMVVLRAAFWNGSHDDVLPLATGTLPAVRQVIQARRQQEEEKSAKELAERVAQNRAKVMAAATVQESMESGYKMLRSVLEEKHNGFRHLADKCVKDAMKAVTRSQEKRKEQEQTQAMLAPFVVDSIDNMEKTFA